MRHPNPVLPGCHPDPSICRVGGDYYLVTSTFAYFPGLPVHHSRDLVSWRLVGHVLDRPSQLPLHGIGPSKGLYAPTIRHHDGVFHVVCTLVDGHGPSGNFLVTATDPAGPWSEPRWLDVDGFDPSLFFDDDGRTWLHGCREVPSDRRGRTEVWLRELHDEGLGPETVIWTGSTPDAVWAEGPHLYKVDGHYVLVCAEGGTDVDHAVVAARSRSITGPYEGHPRNPVLTHREHGRDHQITGTGHADLVTTPDGDWWAVLLAMRPYGGYFYNLGRETFLAPVRWVDGWPEMDPVEETVEAPALEPHPWPDIPARDDFDAGALDPSWFVLRTPDEPFWSFDRPGHLRLPLRPERVTDLVTPSLVCKPQRHRDFAFECALDFAPRVAHESAGLVVLQDNDNHLRLTRDGDVLRLVRRLKGIDEVLATAPVTGPLLWLAFHARGQDHQARYATGPDAWRDLGDPVDGRPLSTPVTGGFTGVHLGLYASANGRESTAVADFDWAEYRELG
ncbi:glycoside hydrolase family 43 protein [Saccharothrix longispora]|uniref:Alpha-N-arabinofuranosidase n=1 Tax=Saccharothrix longispora TaxID=33920 RepID=A0ABU1PP98_9PSEU|nr:glycoside hydrolase family 43 protein [Saccharothrix longispora]MDR6592281.1 alpha-N-arabinofuranosidase [Saccharothrix longispora]